VDLEERWTSCQCQAFMVTFFGVMLFPSPSGVVSFSILPLVSALPHGTFFIPILLSETMSSLSLQLWFCSHLSVIARDQPVGFVSRNRVLATVTLDLPFSRILRVG